MYHMFQRDIQRMNEMYQLEPVNSVLEMAQRIPQFEKILKDECAEIAEVMSDSGVGEETTNIAMDAKVAMADLLADIIVYCASEALRWNIPIAGVLSVVMASNFSKLGEDGQPIKDPDTGKFLKGPRYWKPEPQIKDLLRGVADLQHSIAAR